MNSADPYLVRGAKPVLSGQEKQLLIRLGRAGGRLPLTDLEWPVVRQLLELRAVTEAGRGVALTVVGLGMLAELADG